MTLLFVGLASGLASATLSLSLLSGSMLAFLLFMFAPLPILIASLGWSHRAGLIGIAVAASALLALTGLGPTQSYVLSIGLPAWWLGYLALLARPENDEPDAPVVWYPVGRLVAWAAALGAAPILLTILLAGSVSEYQATLKGVLEGLLQPKNGTSNGLPIQLPAGTDVSRFVELVVLAMPPVSAALSTANTLFNLWLAARIVRASDRLARPWPDLRGLTLPPLALLVFLVSLIGSFVSGFGVVLGILATAFGMAFALLGLAFLHGATSGVGGRAMMLFAGYFLLLVQPWTIIFPTTLGVLEDVFGLRARLAARRAKPRLPGKH